jgi:hypothetical protein
VFDLPRLGQLGRTFIAVLATKTLAGFCLPILLGLVRQYGGGFEAGFLLLAVAARASQPCCRC